MGLNCFLHFWSALGTLSLVWLTKISSAFSSLRRFDFLNKNFLVFFLITTTDYCTLDWLLLLGDRRPCCCRELKVVGLASNSSARVSGYLLYPLRGAQWGSLYVFFCLCEEVGSGTMGGQGIGNDLGFDWEGVG